jgi:carboxymethylenebutenolidase
MHEQSTLESSLIDHRAPLGAVTQTEIDQRVFDLYDEYCHGRIDRREFLKRAGALGVAGLAMAQTLFPNYARAQTISFTDARIKATYVSYPSPGGNSGSMRGYLVQPSGAGPFPAVLVMHENRGLNPYIEDVARRAAVEGFLALAPDGLAPLGGYPGNDDEGRDMQAKLDQGKLRTDMLNGARFLKSHPRSSGKLGATGFCWAAARRISSRARSAAICAPRRRSTARRRRPRRCRGSRRRFSSTTPRATSASTRCGPPTSRR